MTYPVTTYVCIDDAEFSGSFQEPNANSTVISYLPNEQSHLTNKTQGTVNGSNKTYHETVVSSSKSLHRDKSKSKVDVSSTFDHEIEQGSHSVGHISHLPRPSPSRTTYTIPSIMNKSIGIGTVTENGTAFREEENEDFFGMIKLKENDVCYTSGTIEWVGKKRSFPINSGFKIISDGQFGNEPCKKRCKNMNKTFTHEVQNIKECYCPDVLPTMNAIVDHLNALHEAVDLVDLRINTLEDVLSKDNC